MITIDECIYGFEGDFGYHLISPLLAKIPIGASEGDCRGYCLFGRGRFGLFRERLNKNSADTPMNTRAAFQSRILKMMLRHNRYGVDVALDDAYPCRRDPTGCALPNDL